MIQANELRIGNLVNMPFLGSLELEVIGLAVKDDFQLYIQSKSFENTFFEKPEKYSPIPLTEEWFLKFGNIVWLFKDDNGYFVLFNNKRINIDFVHSLQNIYFCIEQKELL